MNNILLLGAGFSRNWGGWLASEVFEYLLSIKQIQENAEIKRLLWEYKDKGGFEAAMGHLKSKKKKDDLFILDRAVHKMFMDMDKGFVHTNLNGHSNMDYSITSWLSMFDGIFTLNQDILLERKYLAHDINISAFSRGKHNSCSMPFLKYEANFFANNPHITTPIVFRPSEEIKNNEIYRKKGVQPYFKLHGSFNWASKDNESLMVLGGQKSEFIKQHDILDCYQNNFKSYLSYPDTRLVTVGYSFGDEHINNTIKTTALAGQLSLFIIDPLGVDVLRTHNKSGGGAVYAKSNLEEAIEPIIVGASRRPLLEIFNGKQNSEWAKVVSNTLNR